ncbi:MAG: hypothetical protein Q4C99_06880 [Clostridia bacterium]|nr:hypothetical protein [Clostridia bacterium]
MKVYDYVKKYLPPNVVAALDKLSPLQQDKLTEIRIRRNMPVVFVTDNNTRFVDSLGNLCFAPNKDSLVVSSAEFDELFNKV